MVNTLNKVLMVIWIASLIVLFVFFFLWVKEDILNNELETEQPPTVKEADVERTSAEKPVEEKVVIPKETIEIGMIGDVLLHLRLAKYKDFTSSFQPMQSTFESYDYLIANQESPPTGPEYALSGYPQFSSPEHIIRDIQKVGVDMVVLANNHIVDKGEGGMTQVFQTLDNYEMPYVGAYRNDRDANTPRIIEVKGIKVAMLAYTYGTNGLFLPDGSVYEVNYINDEKMAEDIAAIKDEVDVVAVSMHWGPEYVTEENAEQNRLAKVLNDAGADIVFGS
ncbi:MAG: CapA family protein, partial [Lysinibacillus sp.]